MYMHLYFFSAGKKDSLNEKDVLFNNLVQDFKNQNLDFPRAVVNEEGTYIIQVFNYEINLKQNDNLKKNLNKLKDTPFASTFISQQLYTVP